MATVEALKERKDIELLKMLLKERNLRHYLLFVIGCNTGLRISDILKLKVLDLYDGKRVRKYLQVQEQKTCKERRIAINARLIDDLHKKIQAPYYLAWRFLCPGQR